MNVFPRARPEVRQSWIQLYSSEFHQESGLTKWSSPPGNQQAEIAAGFNKVLFIGRILKQFAMSVGSNKYILLHVPLRALWNGTF